MGYLRIIAGEKRGRRIAVPAGGGVRPTAGRAREALFSIVCARLPGGRVLDAYAGSGALGFEALSRGAAWVEFVEADPTAFRLLVRNAAALGVTDRCATHRGRVLELLTHGSLPGPFTLILADPPYASAEATRFLEAAACHLAPGGLLVLERESRGGPVGCDALCRTRTATYGRCSFDFFEPSPAG